MVEIYFNRLYQTAKRLKMFNMRVRGSKSCMVVKIDVQGTVDGACVRADFARIPPQSGPLSSPHNSAVIDAGRAGGEGGISQPSLLWGRV